jgi:hypothetical protein
MLTLYMSYLKQSAHTNLQKADKKCKGLPRTNSSYQAFEK